METSFFQFWLQETAAEDRGHTHKYSLMFLARFFFYLATVLSTCLLCETVIKDNIPTYERL